MQGDAYAQRFLDACKKGNSSKVDYSTHCDYAQPPQPDLFTVETDEALRSDQTYKGFVSTKDSSL